MVDIAVLLALIAIVVAAFTVLQVFVSAAQPVEARVNAPAYFDADTVRVLVCTPKDVGVNGSGYLAEIEFEVKGNSGKKAR